MHRLIIAILTALVATTSFAAEAPKPDEQKILYAIGLSVARSLAVFDLAPAELDVVKQGLTDAFSGKKLDPELSSYNEKIQEFARVRRKALGEKQAGAGKEFLEKAAKEKGAVKTPSGMVYQSLKEGKGKSPNASSTVEVNYRGTLTNGKEFDSSYKRNQSISFPLSGVIPCWTEGVQLMKPGGKAKLVCPPELAYGARGAGRDVPPNATLIFEVELLNVK